MVLGLGDGAGGGEGGDVWGGGGWELQQRHGRLLNDIVGLPQAINQINPTLLELVPAWIFRKHG